ncbi:MAG: hypothetical protein PHW22_04500 [Bacilli bacterium]|nr:hypothetical protein [Bacilli bacterium]
MKKNLKKALLVSLVVGSMCTSLASCDSTSSETTTGETTTSEGTTSEETSSVTAVSRIVVTTPDGDPVVGDVIDLDEYVTVVGGEGEKVYTPTVTTPETASVTDHSLTILAEGEVSVTVAAGTKTSKFTVNAVSALMSKYKKYTSTIDKNYAVEALGTNDSNELVGTDITWIHNDNYWAFPNEYLDSTNKTYDGILKAGTGDSYNFTATDRFGADLAVQPGKSSDIANYWMGQPYQDISNKLVTTYDDETGEEAALVTDDYGDFITAACALSFGADWEISISFEFADVLRVGASEPTEELVMLWYVRAAGSTDDYELDSAYAIETAEADYTMPAVEDYIAAGTVPADITLGEVTSTAAKAVEAKNYTMASTIIYTNTSDGTPLTDDEVAALGSNIPTQTATTYVDGSTVYNYVNENGIVYGATTDGTTLSSFNNLGEDSNPTTSNSLTAKGDATAEQIADIWKYAGTIAPFADAATVSGLNVTAKNTAEDGTVTAVGTGLGCNAFILDGVSLVPLYGSSVVNDLLTQKLSDGSSTFADITDFVAIVSDDSLTIQYSLLWDTGIDLNFIVSFGNFGTTTVPEVSAPVTLPTAE